jgi:hypothetical protein
MEKVPVSWRTRPLRHANPIVASQPMSFNSKNCKIAHRQRLADIAAHYCLDNTSAENRSWIVSDSKRCEALQRSHSRTGVSCAARLPKTFPTTRGGSHRRPREIARQGFIRRTQSAERQRCYPLTSIQGGEPHVMELSRRLALVSQVRGTLFRGASEPRAMPCGRVTRRKPKRPLRNPFRRRCTKLGAK